MVSSNCSVSELIEAASGHWVWVARRTVPGSLALPADPFDKLSVPPCRGKSFTDDPTDLADRYSLQRHRYAELGVLPLRYTVWVLPLLGFIGTVVGIARSITGLEAVIAPGAGGQATEGLLVVLGGLRFAFDTTLLGLVTVIPVMLLQMVLGGRESQVTDEAHHPRAVSVDVTGDRQRLLPFPVESCIDFIASAIRAARRVAVMRDSRASNPRSQGVVGK